MRTPRFLNPAGRDGAQVRNLAGSLPANGLKQVSAANYTVGDTVGTVLCSTMYGPVVITLPRAAAYPGRQVTIRKVDAGQEAVKIQSVNGELVTGQRWLSLVASGEFVLVQSDGAMWQVGLHF